MAQHVNSISEREKLKQRLAAQMSERQRSTFLQGSGPHGTERRFKNGAYAGQEAVRQRQCTNHWSRSTSCAATDPKENGPVRVGPLSWQ
jgi:hypothetical protein